MGIELKQTHILELNEGLKYHYYIKQVHESEAIIRTNLVVPSKTGGGSELESSEGGRTSFTVLHRESSEFKLDMFVALIF
jgi:hypothetical protein